MREIIEFRIDEQFAPLLFGSHEGVRLGGSVRRIEISKKDPRFSRIGELQAELRRTKGKPFFYGWALKQRASLAEMRATRLFHLRVNSVFEPAGEECGTKYDDAASCSSCSAGAPQIGPLILNASSIPRSKDIARTIADEIVVSTQACDAFTRGGVTGVVFEPIFVNNNGLVKLGDRKQLLARYISAEVVAPTRVGIDPFDDDLANEYRCARCGLLGLGLTSRLSIDASSVGTVDFVATRQFVGVRRGLLRPSRLLLVSQKVRHIVEQEKLRGFRLEVVDLV